jgi:hypothetical protein
MDEGQTPPKLAGNRTTPTAKGQRCTRSIQQKTRQIPAPEPDLCQALPKGYFIEVSHMGSAVHGSRLARGERAPSRSLTECPEGAIFDRSGRSYLAVYVCFGSKADLGLPARGRRSVEVSRKLVIQAPRLAASARRYSAASRRWQRNGTTRAFSPAFAISTWLSGTAIQLSRSLSRGSDTTTMARSDSR